MVFKIQGKERRELKKLRSKIRSFVKDFWHYHQIDKDMCSVYGSTPPYPMSDEDAKLLFDASEKKLRLIETTLSETTE